MKKLKRFNELLSEDDNFNNDSVIKFEEFSEHRLDGATTITNNAEEKGGDALLTYHHFKVKLPFYEEAVNGNFNPIKSQSQFDNLMNELIGKTSNGIDLSQIEFQELVGKIEVLGELLIKSKDLK
jgi:hypothetical protein